MSIPKCIITGCEFYSPQDMRHVRGDLFEIGNCYIFNALTDGNGNAAWKDGRPGLGDMIIGSRNDAYFERRGVFVFSKTDAEFNDRAEEYLKYEYGRHL